MTVCIAAACDGGKRIVSATDGLISAEEVTSDSLVGKMAWMHEWGILYAGTPCNVALIRGHIESMGVEDVAVFSRGQIQRTVKSAYRRFVAEFSSHDLDGFDMTIEEFKEQGLSFFGSRFHSELARKIRDNASLIRDQLLITGWGSSPISAMIYEVGPSYEALHSDACFASIGSGGHLAQSALLLLGQARHSTLAETIFNVACAKFSAEKSAGLDVGQKTTMYVSRKRSDAEETGRHYGDFIQDAEIKLLRDLWETYLKPRIPDQAWSTIVRIAASLGGGHGTLRDMVNQHNAVDRLQQAKIEAYEEIKKAVSPGPEPPTADPLPRQPSPG